MISIIICSKFPQLERELTSNISQTIGVDYEIISIDNSQRQYNIFEAYNLGVERSKGTFLCFMHEDVIFHSKNWGQIVEHYLGQTFVGALGVAGGNVIAQKLDWRFYGFGDVNLIQGNYTVEELPQYYVSYNPHHQRRALSQVATLDGVWFCIRKDVFNHIHFDDKTFHDFHLYDSDICMQINQMGLGVFMTYDVMLEHKSEGVFSEGYRKGLDAFFKKWESQLPLVKGYYVSERDIDTAVEEAQPRFEERLKKDALIISIRQKFEKKKKGDNYQFTKDEIALMNASAYSFRKTCIKDKKIPFAEAWKLVKEYMNMPYGNRKAKLIYKFIWYRILKQI